jgi:hypothetical protein
MQLAGQAPSVGLMPSLLCVTAETHVFEQSSVRHAQAAIAGHRRLKVRFLCWLDMHGNIPQHLLSQTPAILAETGLADKCIISLPCSIRVAATAGAPPAVGSPAD